MIGSVLAAAVVVVVGMRSPAVEWIAARQLKNLLGVDFDASSAVLRFDGTLSARDVVLRVPGVRGEAGRLLAADRIIVEMDFSRLHRGSIRPETVHLHGAVCRVSVAPDGSMNIDGLGRSDPGSSPPVPPKIDAPHARLELGEHVGERYAVLKSLDVNGSFMPINRGKPEYVIQLQERARAGGSPADQLLALEGRLDLNEPAATLTLHDLSLEQWGPEQVPESIRDLWERLNIRGRIRRSTLTYDPVHGPRVEFHPLDVAIDAPIPSGLPDAPDQPLGLAYVNGTIAISREGVRADLVGLIEGQEEASQVSFTTYGTSLNAAIDCTVTTQNFVIGENPGLLRFMPSVVQRRFADFSGPTAELDARVRIRRGPPDATTGDPGDFNTDGSIVLRRGRFAYEKFPYELTQLRGVVEFDDEKIEIVNLTGRGPSGAHVYATGTFAPPTEDASVELRINAVDLPVDEHLATALKEKRRAVDALFSAEQYQRLLDDELILTSAQAAEAEEQARSARIQLARLQASGAGPAALAAEKERLAEQERTLKRPVFDLGGLATAQVVITHEPEQGWDTDVGVRFEQPIGLLPDPFPLPIIASDLALRIVDNVATLSQGSFTSLRGGSATIEANVKLKKSVPAVAGRPDLVVLARDVPVDNLLIQAIPERDGQRPETGADVDAAALPDPSIQRLLRSLGIEGNVGCTARIDGISGDDATFDVDVTFDELVMNPAGAVDARQRLTIRDASGRITADNRRLAIPWLTGRIVSRPLADAGEEETTACTLGLSYTGSFGDAAEEDDAMRARCEAAGLDVAAPVEEIIALVSPEAAVTLRALREEYRPEGRVDAEVDMERAGESPMRVAVTVMNGRDVALNAPPGRLSLQQREGRVEMVFDEAKSFSAQHLVADIGAAGGSDARLEADGTFVFREDALSSADARIAIADGRLESALIGGLIGRAFGAEAGAAWRRVEPAGVVNLAADVVKREGEELAVRGEVSPRSIAFTREGTRIRIPQVGGRITFGPEGGLIEKLRIQAEGWNAGFDGAWSAPEEGGPAFRVESRIMLSALGLTPELLALTPPRTRKVLEETNAEFRGGLRFHDATLRLDMNEDLAVTGGGVHGVLSFDGLAMDPGVPLSDIAARVNVDAEQVGDNLTVEAAVEADHLRVAGVHLVDASVYMRTGNQPGNLAIPLASATCHGGRISARGLISGLNMTAEDALRYEADVSVTGLRFAPVLAQLDFKGRGEDPDAEAQAPLAAAVLSTDESRGLMDATVTVRGLAGDPGSRSGRGALRINGGDVVELPGVMGLLQLSNLQLPSAERLDYLQAEFFLDGNDVDFEHVSLIADTLSLVGTGRLDWADKSLDFTFNSMSRVRIPIFSDLFEALRNEIVTTTVRGTVADPDVSTRPLSTTGAVLGSMFGADREFRPSNNLQRAEREARAERRRIKAVTGAGGDH